MMLPNIDFEDLKRRLTAVWKSQPAALASANSELIQCQSNSKYLQGVLEQATSSGTPDQIVFEWAVKLSKNFVSLSPS